MSEIDTSLSSEIEDLANSKDELKKRIVALAGTIRKWNEETVKVRKSVRKQLEEIIDIGLNKRNMEVSELRGLVEEIFRYYNISESWFRKLLPVELKDTSKTRLSYLQRQKIENERQRLLQLPKQDFESQLESTQPNVEPIPYQPTEAEIRKLEFPSEHYSQNHEILSLSDSGGLDDVYKDKIQKLEADVRRLSEPFVASATLQAYTETIPLVANVDPVKKEITKIRFE